VHTFYCRNESGRNLVIGNTATLSFTPDADLTKGGWAFVKDDDPNLAYFLRICAAERNFQIDYLGHDVDEVPSDAEGAQVCAVCNKSIKPSPNNVAWQGHMRSHSPKAPKAPKAPVAEKVPEA
jgi:hypothetical protein